MNKQLTPYLRLGGEPAVRQLVDRFYELMDTLPEAEGIREMHADDLSGARDKLFKFLSGWLGGPALYMEEFGHPRLRQRHMPFAIAEAERDAWMLCMERALSELDVDDELLLTQLVHSLRQTADHMHNR